jgi:putative intracellular protease/amidase
LTQLIQKLTNENKLLATICAGPQYLARAGLLKGRNYTTSIAEWNDRNAALFGGVDPFPRETFRNESVVRDGNIITATGVAFIDFALEICSWYDLFASVEERALVENMYKGIN